jgi:hypothetical protein
MEMLGPIVGLIGAGLQAQAQHDQLMAQYAALNFQKQRAVQQDWFAQAGRTDQYGNVTRYDPALNRWVVDMTPMQKDITGASQKEQLLQLTKDAPAARKVKEAIQQRAYEAKEPFHQASIGYQFDKPPSEASLRSDLTGLMAQNQQTMAKANQAALMRASARLGQGVKAEDIIQSTNAQLGGPEAMSSRMLSARQDALKEFQARQQLHEQQWGAPMKMWGDLMAQGGDIPPVPKSMLTDTSGQQQQAMLNAFSQGSSAIGNAMNAVAQAEGKSVDLSGVAKMLADIGKQQSRQQQQQQRASGKGQSNVPGAVDASGDSSSAGSVFDTGADPYNSYGYSGSWGGSWDTARNEYGTDNYSGSLFG